MSTSNLYHGLFAKGKRINCNEFYVPHSVQLLYFHHTSHLSASKLTSYEILDFSSPNTTITHYNDLNPATLIPLPDETYDCNVDLGHYYQS